jgi:hypothetical protein
LKLPLEDSDGLGSLDVDIMPLIANTVMDDLGFLPDVIHGWAGVGQSLYFDVQSPLAFGDCIDGPASLDKLSLEVEEVLLDLIRKVGGFDSLFDAIAEGLPAIYEFPDQLMGRRADIVIESHCGTPSLDYFSRLKTPKQKST